MLKSGSLRSMRRVALFVAATVLTMQFVSAVRACVLPFSASSTPVATAPCAGPGMDSSASCQIQCQKTADQIKPAVDFHVDAVPTSGAWADASFLPPASCSTSFVPPVLFRSVGPPLQILFCTFQS